MRERFPRVSGLAALLVNSAWRWIGEVGTVGPGDLIGRRYRSMGEGSAIGFPPGAVYGEHWISIGSRSVIGPYVSLAVGMPFEVLDQDADPVITIGDRCTIGRGSSIVGRSRIEIEDDVMTGPNVYITDHNHCYADPDVPISQQWPVQGTVRIGAGSWLGTGTVVLPGADIGRQVAVAAGSVVRGSIPDHSVIAGAPARVVRRYVVGEGWVRPGHEKPVSDAERRVAR